MSAERGKLKEAHDNGLFAVLFLLQISANKKELANEKTLLFFLIK